MTQIPLLYVHPWVPYPEETVPQARTLAIRGIGRGEIGKGTANEIESMLREEYVISGIRKKVK
jgi:hypothetical protein